MHQVINRKLLIVDDDADLLKEMQTYFEKNNSVSVASSIGVAEELLKQDFYDAVILDVLLPDGSGLDLVCKIPSHTPVLILSSLGSEDNILNGFSAGICDYVVKPCSMKLLDVRLSMRLLPESSAVISMHGITLDARIRTVTYKGSPIPLTTNEFNILQFLMSHPGTFYTAAEIYVEVWQAPSLSSTSVRFHLHNLRRKLQEATGDTHYMLTKYGKGYAIAREGEEE